VTIASPCVCLITDRRRLAGDARTTRESVLALERWLDGAVDRVDLIQIREPDLAGGVLAGLVQRVSERARGSRTTILVNDRVDVALAADAGGVHLKAGGPPTGRVRALGPADWTVGRAAHSLEEVRREDEVSYLMFGTVFATSSKRADAPLQGLVGLERAVRQARVPVLAIGGMTPERAGQCARVGAAGVAAIGAFLEPGQDPAGLGLQTAATAFREAMMDLINT
jgi:thiamine-phosphate pyrophosphorylase